MIPALYTYAATAAIAAALAFSGAWKLQALRHDAAEKQRIEQEAKDLHRRTERATASSSTYEDKKAKNEIRYRNVTVTLEKIIERPVYLNQCFDADGLRELNAQIKRSAYPGEPQLKLPKP